MLRTEIVRSFPSLAGLYAAIGMPVNIIGLEFQDAKTLTTFRDGKKVMTISARIRSVAGQIVHVPPVQVSLLGEDGATIYEWTTTPQAREMAPGDLFDFSTEVNSPPEGAAKVRLSFSNRAGGTPSACPAPVATRQRHTEWHASWLPKTMTTYGLSSPAPSPIWATRSSRPKMAASPSNC